MAVIVGIDKRLTLKTVREHNGKFHTNSLKLKANDDGCLMVWIDCGRLGSLGTRLDEQQQKQLIKFVQSNIK